MTASTATLRTTVAIPATSMLDRLDAMRHFWRQSSGDEAKKENWTVISMKNDWKRMFAFD